MDILSQKTLMVLRDKNVRETIDQLIDQRTTSSKTVELAATGDSSSGEVRQGTRVLIRRIA